MPCWGSTSILSHRTVCAAIKSRLLLYAASPLWNGSFPYPDWKNTTFETPGYGTELVSHKFDIEKWRRAKEAAEDAIEIAKANGREIMDLDDLESINGLYSTVNYDKIYIERSVKDSGGKELSAQELLARGDLLLVYGPSGMGKTEYVKQLRRAVDSEVLTVVVRCSDFWRSDKTVYEYLCENVAKGVQNAAFTDKHFERLWDSKDRLVVFDGLDEVPTTDSTDLFFQKISEFCRIKADNRRTQILFTSRNKDDANRFANDPTDIKSPLRSFELQPLNDDQIRKLCVSLSKVFEFDDEYFFFKIKRLDKEIKVKHSWKNEHSKQ